jgi:hypothetical protein
VTHGSTATERPQPLPRSITAPGCPLARAGRTTTFTGPRQQRGVLQLVRHSGQRLLDRPRGARHPCGGRDRAVVETQCHYFASLAFPQRLEAGLRVRTSADPVCGYEVGIFARAPTPVRRGGRTSCTCMWIASAGVRWRRCLRRCARFGGIAMNASLPAAPGVTQGEPEMALPPLELDPLRAAARAIDPAQVGGGHRRAGVRCAPFCRGRVPRPLIERLLQVAARAPSGTKHTAVEGLCAAGPCARHAGRAGVRRARCDPCRPGCWRPKYQEAYD